MLLLKPFRSIPVPRILQSIKQDCHCEVYSSIACCANNPFVCPNVARNHSGQSRCCNLFSNSPSGILPKRSITFEVQIQGSRGFTTNRRVKHSDDEPTIDTDHHDHVITVPLHLRQRLEKKIIRESTKGHQRLKIVEASRRGRRTDPLIHCKHPELNHFVGQTYGRHSEIPFASKGWTHKKAVGDWFTIRPVSQSPTHGFLEGSEATFEGLGVTPDIVKVLQENKAIKPTTVQEIAIPEILKGSNNVVAAETGCGKTLAYLIPVVQKILLEKRGRRKRGVNQPFSIVLVPSRELADQIYYVATKLTEDMGIKVTLLQGGNLASKMSSPPASEVDLLISTVNVVSILTSAGVYNTRSVQHVVLDEADTLLDDSFSEDVLAFLKKFPFFPNNDRETQLTLVSATMPKNVETFLDDIVPLESLNRIATPALHRVLSHVPQTFLRLNKSSKPEKLLNLVQSDLKNNIPVMIFCNKTQTCDWMYIFFKENGINCMKIHGETRPMLRKGLLDKYQTGEVNVMICSDLGSRGINTVRTGHVINYEFPTFLADYIHRCGRTGRVGAEKKGQVTNFISGRFEVSVVNEIEKSVRKELSLPRVNANIKRLLSSRYGMFQPILPVDEDGK